MTSSFRYLARHLLFLGLMFCTLTAADPAAASQEADVLFPQVRTGNTEQKSAQSQGSPTTENAAAVEKRLQAIENRLGAATRQPSPAATIERRLADIEQRLNRLEQQYNRLQLNEQRNRRLDSPRN